MLLYRIEQIIWLFCLENDLLVSLNRIVKSHFIDGAVSKIIVNKKIISIFFIIFNNTQKNIDTAGETQSRTTKMH